jgi:hypothetical protein
MPRLTQTQVNDYYRALYEETGECLIWTGGKDHDGYGKKWNNGRNHLVHRLVWAEANGPIPPGLLVKHRCDQKACYRVDHLEIGTNAGNVRESVERWLVPFGETHGAAKLTADQVRTIRNSPLKNRAAAEKYNVGMGAIRGIRTGKTWKHLT